VGAVVKRVLQKDPTKIPRALAALGIGLTLTGPAPVDRIMTAAKAAGYTRTMIKRARHNLGVVSSRSAAGGWQWELPA
jgi:hypothetical protein